MPRYLFVFSQNNLVLSSDINPAAPANVTEPCVSPDKDKLTAKAWGEKANPKKHRTAVEVKGATYTELHVVQNTAGQWLAQCVVDV